MVSVRNLQLKSADVFCKALKETANFNYVMSKEKSKSSTSVLAADEKFLNSCANRTAEIFKKQLATICEEIKQDFKSIFEAEIAVLKTEISELKKSQTFISTQYDEILEINRNQSDELKILMNSYEDLKFNHNKLKAINEKQNEDMKILREKADVLDKKTNDEAVKLDGIDQYSRRQNLEFQGIPLTENEDAIELVTKISNLVGVDVKKSDISTAHRLPPKRHAKVADPPAIIARFINRNLRNEIYGKRIAAKHLKETDYPISGMKKLFINENLTQERKRLLWLTKQTAKNLNYTYIWTMNGKIYVRKNEDSSSFIIHNENDLSKL